jgi:hypothetical protein
MIRNSLFQQTHNSLCVSAYYKNTTTGRATNRESDRIQKHTEEFLEAGGEVEMLKGFNDFSTDPKVRVQQTGGPAHFS